MLTETCWLFLVLLVGVGVGSIVNELRNAYRRFKHAESCRQAPGIEAEFEKRRLIYEAVPIDRTILQIREGPQGVCEVLTEGQSGDKVWSKFEDELKDMVE